MNILRRTSLFFSSIFILSAISFSSWGGGVELNRCPCRWLITGSLGHTFIGKVCNKDDEAKKNEKSTLTPFYRFAIGYEPYTRGRFTIGGELGFQSGGLLVFPPDDDETAPLSPETPPSVDPDILNSILSQVFATPTLDLLATLRIDFSLNRAYSFFALLKGGPAYRRICTLTDSSINKKEYSFEMQAGIGMRVCECTRLSLLYQVIYWGKPFGCNKEASPILSALQIPFQHGIMLTITRTL